MVQDLEVSIWLHNCKSDFALFRARIVPFPWLADVKPRCNGDAFAEVAVNSAIFAALLDMGCL
jgi:hypothetical protein